MREIKMTMSEFVAVSVHEPTPYADLSADAQQSVLANIDELIADGYLNNLSAKPHGNDADSIYIGGAGETGKWLSLKTAIIGREMRYIRMGMICRGYSERYGNDVWTAAVPVKIYAEHVAVKYSERAAKLFIEYWKKPTTSREVAVEEFYFRKSVQDVFERAKHEH